jgi:hypothetical protein
VAATSSHRIDSSQAVGILYASNPHELTSPNLLSVALFVSAAATAAADVGFAENTTEDSSITESLFGVALHGHQQTE